MFTLNAMLLSLSMMTINGLLVNGNRSIGYKLYSIHSNHIYNTYVRTQIMIFIFGTGMHHVE